MKLQPLYQQYLEDTTRTGWEQNDYLPKFHSQKEHTSKEKKNK